MKLYGVCITIVPEKDTRNAWTVICVPIAVSDEKLDRFEVLQDLAFTQKADTQKGLMDCFMKAVHAVDATMQLQEQSLHEHGLPYRPIAMYFGQDSRRPIHINGFHTRLFGAPYSYFNRDAPTFLDKIREEDAKKNFLQHTKDLSSSYLKKYNNACNKFADLLEACSLQNGSFTLVPQTKKEKRSDRAFGEQVKKLRRRIWKKHDPHAHLQLRELAREQGRQWGEKTTEEPAYFALNKPLKSPAEKKEIQRQHPELAFYHWDPAYEEAFYEGFNDTYIGPHNRRIKLPFEPSSPPFTDPCADLIRDQFEIIKGRRTEDGIRDEWEERENIAKAARNVGTILGRSTRDRGLPVSDRQR